MGSGMTDERDLLERCEKVARLRDNDTFMNCILDCRDVLALVERCRKAEAERDRIKAELAESRKRAEELTGLLQESLDGFATPGAGNKYNDWTKRAKKALTGREE